jgi:pimeloyl-ACP methyl ester carboxylesterase
MSAKNPTIIFVPGSWLHPDIYKEETTLLSDFPSEIVILPTTGMRPGSPDMKEDIEAIHAVLTKETEQGNDIILIMHSAGGLIGTEAAKGFSKSERLASDKVGGVVSLIYVAAVIPYLGKNILEMNAEYWKPRQDALFKEKGPPEKSHDEMIQGYVFENVRLMSNGEHPHLQFC